MQKGKIFNFTRQVDQALHRGDHFSPEKYRLFTQLVNDNNGNSIFVTDGNTLLQRNIKDPKNVK